MKALLSIALMLLIGNAKAQFVNFTTDSTERDTDSKVDWVRKYKVSHTFINDTLYIQDRLERDSTFYTKIIRVHIQFEKEDSLGRWYFVGYRDMYRTQPMILVAFEEKLVMLKNPRLNLVQFWY